MSITAYKYLPKMTTSIGIEYQRIKRYLMNKNIYVNKKKNEKKKRYSKTEDSWANRTRFCCALGCNFIRGHAFFESCASFVMPGSDV